MRLIPPSLTLPRKGGGDLFSWRVKQGEGIYLDGAEQREGIYLIIAEESERLACSWARNWASCKSWAVPMLYQPP